MKCLIPSINFKVLGKAVGTLSKIGDELYVEPYSEGIYFRTVNANRSAFATFNFTQSFFSFYNLNVTNADQTTNLNTSNRSTSIIENIEEAEPTKCKVSMKSVLSVFRMPANNVETCQLQLEANGGQLIFQLRCRHSIRKTYYVPVIESETVQAVYNKDMVPNRFCAQSKVLSEILQNFQNNHEEISLTVSPTRIYFRNYSDTGTDSRRAAVRTELCLEPLEFDSLTVGTDTTVTFSLRELRALLQFAEATSLPVSAHFEVAGRPVVLIISSLPSFEAHFVLATMTQQPGESQQSQANSSQASSSNQSFISSRVRKRPNSVLANREAEINLNVSNHIFDTNTAEEREQVGEMEAAEQDIEAAVASEQTASKNINATPPGLKAQQFYFPYCFQDTQETKKTAPSPIVLAPDSDPEDEF